MTSLSGDGVRVLLVGTGTHVPGSELPSVSAAARSVHDLAAALVNQCGLLPSNLRTVIDPADPLALGDKVIAAASEAQDVLLIYYVGHGLVSLGGELHLATVATDDPVTGLAFKALPYSAVRDALMACQARSINVVLDCCFSGRANASFGTAIGDAFEVPHVDGSFLLASAARDEAALAPEDAHHTAFTGELLRLINQGDQTGPPELTLEHVYRYMSRVSAEQGFPAPHRRSGNRAGDLLLTRNRAYRAPTRIDDPRAATTAPSAAPIDQECPYRGLRAFTVHDARYFFGREKATAELVRRLADRTRSGGPLAVVGASGSGKSSLIHAGALPALREGARGIPGSSSWPQRTCTPGSWPLQRLASVFASPLNRNVNELQEELYADPGCANAIARQVVAALTNRDHADGARLVLVVDQFEEVFSTCEDEGQRRSFIRALAAVSQHQNDLDPPAVVVLGIRADFYRECLSYPDLVSSLESGQFVVETMKPTELYEAIEKPALAVGLSLDKGLPEVLLRDLRAGHQSMQDTTETLPLLSFALQATWQQRRGRVLTVEDYHAAGGVWNAVAQQAERVYTYLGQTHGIAGLDAVRVLMSHLIHISDGTDSTRRRINVGDLVRDRSEHEASAITAALGTFAGPDSRLITLDQDSAQISHEALIRAWPRLSDWIATSRAGLLIHQKLTDAANTWHREGRDPATLYRGSRLIQVQDWARWHSTDLSGIERDFLRASKKAERRRRTRQHGVVTILTLLLIGAVVSISIARYQTSVADEQTRLATAGRLNTEAEEIRDQDPVRSLKLDLAARNLAQSVGHAAGEDTAPELVNFTKAIESDLASTLPAAHYVGTTPSVRNLGPVSLSPNGEVMSTTNKKGVTLWGIKNPGQPNLYSSIPLKDELSSFSTNPPVEFLRNGQMLAINSLDRGILLWDVHDLTQPRELSTIRPCSPYQARKGEITVVSPLDVQFSRDGKLAAVGCGHRSNMVSLWDIGNPAQPKRVGSIASGNPNDTVSPMGISNSGHKLAVKTENNGNVRRVTTTLWDITDPSQPHQASTIADDRGVGVKGLAFNQKGDVLAASDPTRGLILWDIRNPYRPRPFGSLPEENIAGGFVERVVFGPDGRTLTASGSDGATFWDISNLSHPRQLGPVLTNSDTTPVISPGGSTLATPNSFVSPRDGEIAVNLWGARSPILTRDPARAQSFSADPVGNACIVTGGGIMESEWEIEIGYDIPYEASCP